MSYNCTALAYPFEAMDSTPSRGIGASIYLGAVTVLLESAKTKGKDGLSENVSEKKFRSSRSRLDTNNFAGSQQLQ